MIVAEMKPFEEIKEMLGGYSRVLVLGCGSCVTVCLSGGERQSELLASALRMARKIEGNIGEIAQKTILRQCDPEFISQIRNEILQCDAVLSMACGVGVQSLVREFREMPVLPAMNTRFMGMTDGKGTWQEACSGCGECVLAMTGGICPVTTCPKGILNGPCGGNKDGWCEVTPELQCAWVRIYERLKLLNRLDDFKYTIKAKDWTKKQRPGIYRAEK
jgi:ferredoxin